MLSCTYSARAGRAIAFGLPSSKHFQITYNYFAGGELHNGQFFSEKAIPQGSLFPIRYHPDLPHRNEHTDDPSRGKTPLIAFGVAGSVVLSFLWFLVLRGCH